MKELKIESKLFVQSVGKKTVKAIKSAKAGVKDKSWPLKESRKLLASDNWFERAATSCETLSDAVMRDSNWTDRGLRIAAAKLGAATVPASLFSVAGLVGTASTGTAIGSLSGAAFTSSALAWIGGSVVMGTVVVSAASAVGLVAAPVVVKPLADKYLIGKARKPDELHEAERDVVNACCALALGLREAGKEGASLDAKRATVLRNEALNPLMDRLTDVAWLSTNWPVFQRKQFKKAFWNFGQQIGFASQVVSNSEPLVVGLGAALLLNLLSEGEHTFSDAELDVLKAVRRSSEELSKASNEEIAAHIQGMTPEQLLGFRNNIKGIAHELQFARTENSDGDEFVVELFESANHAGADIRLINSLTGDVREFQLKATAYGTYVRDHVERYPDIPVMVTTEVAVEEGIATTGIANESLEHDINSTLSGLDLAPPPEILDSMALAGLVTLARNVNAILTRGPDQAAQRKKLVAEGAQAGLVAGIAELLI